MSKQRDVRTPYYDNNRVTYDYALLIREFESNLNRALYQIDPAEWDDIWQTEAARGSEADDRDFEWRFEARFESGALRI